LLSPGRPGSPRPAPLSPDEVATALERSAQGSAVLLAVSGGPDSACLLHLAAAWRRGGEAPLHVATVDHGLRPDAAGEAEAVAGWCAALAIPHATLRWTGGKPRAGIHAAAREARYRLLAEHAAAVGAAVLMTAHHADDQAETVLMRLARGSGLHGLRGMDAVTRLAPGLLLARPLLAFPKERLLATLEARGLPFFEDPSNVDPRYGRARARALARLLESEGLDRARLLRLAERARRADEVLAAVAGAAHARHRSDPCQGQARGLGPGLFDEPEEILVRVLERALAEGEGAAPLRLERIEALALALREARAGGRRLRRSLAGRLVTLDRHARVTIEAEKPRSRGRSGSVHAPTRSGVLELRGPEATCLGEPEPA
jgi:tRNA(Ile)-lysidine synthase